MHAGSRFVSADAFLTHFFSTMTSFQGIKALVREWDEPACAVIKHANPCGAAVADDPLEAYERAVACDPRSAFGGIVALNRPLTADVARAMAVPERFLEVVIAPGIDEDAADGDSTAPTSPY